MALPHWGVQNYVQTYVVGQGGGGTTSGTWGDSSVTESTQYSYGGFDLQSEASAKLQGMGISPLLTAYASITPVSGGSLDGYFAQASAIGIEYYQFIGDTPVIYHVEANLNGSTQGSGRIQYGVLIQKGALDQNALDASEFQNDLILYDYSVPYSTNVTLIPGDFFSIKMYLNAKVDGISGPGIADASNTFYLDFSSGDLGYLIPQSGQSTPVPEPSTMLLLGSGLLGLVGYGRKKFFKK